MKTSSLQQASNASATMTVSTARLTELEVWAVRALIDQVYTLMTARTPKAAVQEKAHAELAERLPEADVSHMEGVLELLSNELFKGRADLPHLVDESDLTDDELLPVAQALGMLGFARVEYGDIYITPIGRQFVEGSNDKRQEIFGRQLLQSVPLAAHIRHSLEQEESGELPEKPFLALLRDSMDKDEAEKNLRIAIEWGRYGEVFEYNYSTGQVHLPKDDAQGKQ